VSGRERFERSYEARFDLAAGVDDWSDLDEVLQQRLDNLLARLGSEWEVEGLLFEGELHIDATRVVHASAPSQENVRTSVSIWLNDVPKGEDDRPPKSIRLTFHLGAEYDTAQRRAPSDAKPSMVQTEPGGFSWPMVVLWCLCFGLFVLLGGFKEGAPVGKIAFEAMGIGLAVAGAVLVVRERWKSWRTARALGHAPRRERSEAFLEAEFQALAGAVSAHLRGADLPPYRSTGESEYRDVKELSDE
jgi:hypothetical protein